jgi:hypothetical protein
MKLDKKKYFDKDELRRIFAAIENWKSKTPQKKRDKKPNNSIFGRISFRMRLPCLKISLQKRYIEWRRAVSPGAHPILLWNQ